MKHRQRGTALVSALIFTIVISSLVGASLLLAQNNYALSYSNARTEAALHLAEAGINDEIHYIATHLGAPNVTDVSSQPAVAAGETATYPGEVSVIKGRKGQIEGRDDDFWVYSSLDEAGTTGWDGKTPEFWITATAHVDGAWRRSKVKVKAVSIFTLHAIFALASYENASNAIQMSSATVSVVGTGGTNGTMTYNNSTITVSDAINANTQEVSSGQFLNSHVSPGGGILTRESPVIYPSVTTVLKRYANRNGDTTAQIWSWIANSANNDNDNGVYTYAPGATSSTINAANTQVYNLNATSLYNKSGSSLGLWQNAGIKPGSYQSVNGLSIKEVENTTPITVTTNNNHNLSTGAKVTVAGVGGTTAANGNWTITRVGPKSFTLNGSAGNAAYTSGGNTYPSEIRTLIFQPGDYYFSSVDLGYDHKTEFVIDPQAYASGGTPGQIRFWIYDPANGTQNDTFQLPIKVTLANGQTVADPSYFRIYYGKDKKTFQFKRPSAVSYLDESTHALKELVGDFVVFGGVYAVTKLPGDSTSLTGTEIDFTGTTGGDGGTIKLVGSLLADKISFHGPCSILFQESDNPADPFAGVGVIGGYSDGW